MKENLILVNYKVESEAYQALSELKRETSNANHGRLCQWRYDR